MSLMLLPVLGLFIGIVMGYAAQRSRFCIQGAIRDWLMFRDTYFLDGVVTAVLAFSLVYVFGFAQNP